MSKKEDQNKLFSTLERVYLRGKVAFCPTLSRKKAFGLIEVLIAIAISSVIMMGAVVVSVRGMRMVKENELRDVSSGVLLRSLEISRSPVSFNLSSQMGSSNRRYFALETDDQGKFKLVAKSSVEDLSSCEENSEYKVDITGTNYLICNQIQVSKLNENSIRRSFEVKSIVVYNLYQNDIAMELTSYRTEIVTD